METSAVLLVICVGIWMSLLLTVLAWLFFRALRARDLLQSETRKKELDVLDKALVLLSTKDPISYQAVQAMDFQDQYTSHYDPSDEGEIQRIHEREGDRDGFEERMNDAEREFLDDFLPGIGN